MRSTTMTLRMNTHLLNQLKFLAEATQRSCAFLALEAISEYLEKQSWQVQEIKQGLKEVEAGDIIDHNTVVKKWKQKHAHSLDQKSRA